MYASDSKTLLLAALVVLSLSLCQSMPVNIGSNQMGDHDADPFGAEDRSERFMRGDDSSDNDDDDEFHDSFAEFDESLPGPCNEVSRYDCSRCCAIEGFSKPIWNQEHYCECA